MLPFLWVGDLLFLGGCLLFWFFGLVFLLLLGFRDLVLVFLVVFWFIVFFFFLIEDCQFR